MAGHKQMFEQLLDCGAEVDSEDIRGETGLIKAAAAGDCACLQLFLKAGAKINMKDTYWVENPDFLDDDQGGKTAIIQAALTGHVECVTALLEAKADPNLKDNAGGHAR